MGHGSVLQYNSMVLQQILQYMIHGNDRVVLQYYGYIACFSLLQLILAAVETVQFSQKQLDTLTYSIDELLNTLKQHVSGALQEDTLARSFQTLNE